MDEGYEGAAVLVVAGAELPVGVRLRGRFEPIDGRYHWYGRIEPSEELSALLDGSGRAAATLRTGHGEAPAQLSDPDPWGRYRIDGVSTPPFPVTA